MKEIKIFTLLVMIIIQAAESSEECVIESDNWSTCKGQIVKLKGLRPQPIEIMQHPLIDPFGIQSYLHVNQRQLIILSQMAIDCAENEVIEVLGKLDEIALGGPPETKNSYKNWFIRVTEFQCLSLKT